MSQLKWRCRECETTTEITYAGLVQMVGAYPVCHNCGSSNMAWEPDDEAQIKCCVCRTPTPTSRVQELAPHGGLVCQACREIICRPSSAWAMYCALKRISLCESAIEGDVVSIAKRAIIGLWPRNP